VRRPTVSAPAECGPLLIGDPVASCITDQPKRIPACCCTDAARKTCVLQFSTQLADVVPEVTRIAPTFENHLEHLVPWNDVSGSGCQQQDESILGRSQSQPGPFMECF